LQGGRPADGDPLVAALGDGAVLGVLAGDAVVCWTVLPDAPPPQATEIAANMAATSR